MPARGSGDVGPDSAVATAAMYVCRAVRSCGDPVAFSVTSQRFGGACGHVPRDNLVGERFGVPGAGAVELCNTPRRVP